MVSEAVYTSCVPILADDSLEEEDKTEKLEELLAAELSLSGKNLESAVLDVLWRYRDAGQPSSISTPPTRHIVIRKSSPAPWQQNSRSSTPLPTSPISQSPAPPPGLGMAPPMFALSRSTGVSPFGSPRPSPRLAFSSPRISNSPSLNSYDFATEAGPSVDGFGEYGSDSVDLLVQDDANSNPSSLGAGNGFAMMQNMGQLPAQVDMGPYDILRSVFGEEKSDIEIERALEASGYDFNTTLMSLMDIKAEPKVESKPTVIVGKSMTSVNNIPRPVTPSGGSRSGVICKFFLSTGNCLRADCRFSHDLSTTICKYWVMGNCLAGETCIFSHDPSNLVNRFSFEGSPASTPPAHSYLGSQENFPSLNPNAEAWSGADSLPGSYKGSGYMRTPPQGHKQLYHPENSNYKSNSRPSSRHQVRDHSGNVPAVDDVDAFPTLGSMGKAGGKKHHGKRGHGHAHKEYREVPSSLADVVKMSPSQSHRDVKVTATNNKGGGSKNAAAASIPAPQHIPWLETGDTANKQYLHARASAIKHGAQRNKFLQSAQQAWTRNDARAAKALSLRGQSENDLMRKAHREAARFLYEERNKNAMSNPGMETYIDLHGLHQEEAISYLEDILLKHQNPVMENNIVYAITGTGHHSKQGRDKIGKAIKGWLDEWRYAYREFSVPGDRNSAGGILGIDASSWDRSLTKRQLHQYDIDESSSVGITGKAKDEVKVVVV